MYCPFSSSCNANDLHIVHIGQWSLWTCFTVAPPVQIPLQRFNEDSQDFQARLIKRSGLGDETYLPPGLSSSPLDITMTSARMEAEMVMFSVVRDLLESTGVRARDVGILIVNCSLFNPTPSLSAMIVNHFKMRSDIKSYNLAGMGCSAGMISVGLANEMFKVSVHQYQNH